MKAMFAAFVALVVITVGAWYGLNHAGFSIQDRTSGDAVRLG
ncbi:hypothetical protein [Oceanibium sediminis]|nr:hypothetical protein [Oceanibium sediminis]